MDTLDNPNKIVDPSTVGYQSLSLRHGAIAGLILIILGLVANLTGIADPSEPNVALSWILNIVNFGILIAFMVVAVKKHREEDLGGFITFGRAFGVSFLVVLVVSVITAVWMYIYMGYIDPSMTTAMLENAVNQQGAADNEAVIEQMSFMFKPGFLAISGFLFFLILGVIFSLIVSAVMKKNPPGHI